ncbi:MAG: hypothetical protein OEZ68_10805 [Gammaproteobacteria bacterium]|nr:hypothetical protein [Gammaproteobacteria bacterium]MDH5801282.1 hypothetical protein [Gammaproteobacteria bacterium]
MTHTNLLVEQHIKSHMSRLQHIDELAQKAEKSGDARAQEELQALKQEQNKLADYVQQFSNQSAQQFLQTAGPMVMWEIVAQRLEQLVEKIHH